MAALNPGWVERHASVAARPDGDVDLEETVGLRGARLRPCGGVLKPDVVFFGENVPAARVRALLRRGRRAGSTPAARCWSVGTSLTVMSGFRFVRRAARAGTPVVIVNRGATRGDDLATYKVDAGCSEFLTALAG